MALKLMYITNRIEIAQIAETAGVDRIFIDMEYIGKAERQSGMNTVKSHHTFSDVKKVRESINDSQVLVRCNPIHYNIKDYPDTREELDMIISAGADIIMLPYFKKVDEVSKFIEWVDKRAKVMLLTETVEAVNLIDEILNLQGIDEIFIGLNDLSIGYKKKFMFELLADGTVERLCIKFKEKNIPYGFGGIAALGQGELQAEKIIKEHYRLGSSCVILSRSFCNLDKVQHMGTISKIFIEGINKIRRYEKNVKKYSDYFFKNEKEVQEIIKKIISLKELV